MPTYKKQLKKSLLSVKEEVIDFITNPTPETADKAFKDYHGSLFNYKAAIRSGKIEALNHMTDSLDSIKLFPVENQKENFWLSVLYSPSHAKAFSNFLSKKEQLFMRNAKLASAVFEHLENIGYQCVNYNAAQKNIIYRLFDKKALEAPLKKEIGSFQDIIKNLPDLWLEHYDMRWTGDQAIKDKTIKLYQDTVEKCADPIYLRVEAYEACLKKIQSFYEESQSTGIWTVENNRLLCAASLLYLQMWATAPAQKTFLTIEDRLNILDKTLRVPQFINNFQEILLNSSDLYFEQLEKTQELEMLFEIEHIVVAGFNTIVFEKSCQILSKSAVLQEKIRLEKELEFAGDILNISNAAVSPTGLSLKSALKNQTFKI